MRGVACLTVFLALCFIHSAFSIRCYICNNFDSPRGCGPNESQLSLSYIQDCGTDELGRQYTLCEKTVVTFYNRSEVLGHRIRRSCSTSLKEYSQPHSAAKSAISNYGPPGHWQGNMVGECNTKDGCNV